MLTVTIAVAISLLLNTYESSPLELTTDTFQSKMDGLDLVLVKFYAEWCGHCKQLAPVYEAASKKLLQHSPPVTLVKVNCPENEAVCKEFDVTGYPTLKLFRKGKSIGNYEGGRTENDIVDYMISRSYPPLREVKSKEELDQLRGEDKSVFVATVNSKESSLAKAFFEIADSLGFMYIFVMTTDKNIVGESEKIRRFLPLRYKTKLEDEMETYSGSAVVGDIEKWVNDVWGGILPTRKANNVANLSKRPLMIVYAKVDYEKDPKGTNYIRNRVLKAINEVKGSMPEMKYNFGVKSDLGEEEAEFDWNGEDSENIHVGIFDENEIKYKMEKEFNWKNVKEFLLDFKAKKIKSYIKSESIESDEKTAVQRVVGLNFEELISKSKKDILIEFYAPWCGHCKSLKPKYEELAQKMSGEDNLMIAAIDATANDFPKNLFSVQGFPSIFFVPAGQKPINYQGGREIEDFIKFVAEKSTKPLKTFDKNGKSTKDEL